MKNRTNSEILQQLMQITRAAPVEPTEKDKEELQLLEEQSVRSERDSKQYAEHRARVKRERELFEQGRNDSAMQTA